MLKSNSALNKLVVVVIISLLSLSNLASAAVAQADPAAQPADDVDRLIKYDVKKTIKRDLADAQYRWMLSPGSANFQSSVTNLSSLDNSTINREAREAVVDILESNMYKGYAIYAQPTYAMDNHRGNISSTPSTAFKFHTELYCSQYDVSSKVCAEDAQTLYPYYDANVATLLQPTVAKDDAASEKLLGQLIFNMTTNFKEGMDASAEIDAEKAGKRLAARAAESAPVYSFYSMWKDRKADGGESSALQALEKESTWRMTDPNWVGDLHASSQEALLRELAQIEAAKLFLQYKQYRQQERMEALLAVMTSKMNAMVGMTDVDVDPSAIPSADAVSKISV